MAPISIVIKLSVLLYIIIFIGVMILTNTTSVARYLLYKVNGQTKKVRFAGLQTLSLSDLTSTTQIINNGFNLKIKHINEVLNRHLTPQFQTSTISYDSDLTIWLNQSITQPGLGTKNAMNAGFQSFKAGANNFSKHDRIYFNCSEYEDNAFVSWVNSTSTVATKISTPTWIKFRGFTGGSGKAINSHYVPNVDGVNFTRNSCCAWVLLDTFFNAVEVIIGNTNIQIFPNFNGDIYAQVNGALVNITAASIDKIFLSVNRPTSATTEIWANGTLIHSAASNSSAPTSEEIYMLAANAGGLTLEYHGELLAAGWGSGAMNQLELYNSVNTVWGGMPFHQVLGDSVGAGFNATTPETQGMYQLYCNSVGYGLYNLSTSGYKALDFINSGKKIRPKTYNNGQKIFIEFGINDAIAGAGTTAYKANLETIKTMILAVGWSITDIIMVTGNHIVDNGSGSLATYLTYRAKAKEFVADNPGMLELDLYPDNIDLFDDVHPSTLGHSQAATIIISRIG